MRKKGLFAIFSDIWVYLAFIVVFILFLTWVSLQDAGTENFVKSELESQDANTILMNLMRSPVSYDLNNDSVDEAQTIADLISLGAEDQIVRDEIWEVMKNVCPIEKETTCEYFYMDIEGYGQLRPPDAPRPDINIQEDTVSHAVMHLPKRTIRDDGTTRQEVVKVELFHISAE